MTPIERFDVLVRFLFCIAGHFFSAFDAKGLSSDSSAS
jgi:hypothetical protein